MKLLLDWVGVDPEAAQLTRSVPDWDGFLHLECTQYPILTSPA
jgi:hypothetical protein